MKEAHVKAKAIGLDVKNNCLKLDNGNSIEYTDLVIATGTSSPFPGKLGLENPAFSKTEVIERYSNLRKEVNSLLFLVPKQQRSGIENLENDWTCNVSERYTIILTSVN